MHKQKAGQTNNERLARKVPCVTSYKKGAGSLRHIIKLAIVLIGQGYCARQFCLRRYTVPHNIVDQIGIKDDPVQHEVFFYESKNAPPGHMEKFYISTRDENISGHTPVSDTTSASIGFRIHWGWGSRHGGIPIRAWA